MNLLKRYIFWTYERGSLHYDIMVSLILVFLFVSPRYIDFGDKPVPATPRPSSEVRVREQGSTGNEARFVYEIPVAEMHGATSDTDVQAAILAVVGPIAGDVVLERYVPVNDAKGHVVAYDATVHRRVF